MNKQKLLDSVLQEGSLETLSRREGYIMLNATFEIIKKTIKKKGKVNILGLGTFLKVSNKDNSYNFRFIPEKSFKEFLM